MNRQKHKAPKVLMIDNYDSFTYNVLYLLKQCGAKALVVPNDISLLALEQLCEKHSIAHLIISPGPSHPLESGVCLDAIRHFAPTKKILGICLGHQCIAQAFGGEVISLANPTHGKNAHFYFTPHPLFKGIRQGVKVALYHSLYVSKLGQCEALGYSESGVLLALKARDYQSYGVQFHPESILQEQGRCIVQNFLAL
ncbi:aminodeoxychorismate/anthranilate synthase component II [Helicobacter sp. MIT 21-1697]|uniref:anthranilate synthase component II n=1 Tax=Helicobacter sp. MIT 21-1697 TaxID=2993733 RepID=UPI00224B3EE7|nr:aminodeoxychorismate/anthranilate synthase component II [Helicobacter sp. MIT 21-1697]MCX2717326.1 aminodeoxychorismate/anthranilate synthase component II [Helicobacter sp. MIT 21-1697]